MAQRYSLYFSVRSPFARRIRVAMAKLSLSFEERAINVFEPTPDFLAANPLGLVPVLVVDEKPGVPGHRYSIPDSSTILEYLHENYAERIWPRDLPARARVRAASTLATGLMAETVKWFLEQQRPNPSPEWSKESLENIDRTLGSIAETSVKSMPWKVSDLQLTQAGYDLMIALEYMALRLKVFDWTGKYPALAQFLELHRNRQDLAPTTPPA